MWCWIAGLWLMGIVALSTVASRWPGVLNAWTAGVPGRDKTGHFVLMGGLAGAAVLAFAGRPLGGSRVPAWAVLAVVTLLVVAEEWAQRWLIYRSFSLEDLAYSLAGVALVGGIAWWWRARAESPASPPAQR